MMPEDIGRLPKDLTETYATIGVEPMVSMEEVFSVYHAKIKYARPDGTQDLEGRKVREDRTKRLNLAYEAIQKARQGR